MPLWIENEGIAISVDASGSYGLFIKQGQVWRLINRVSAADPPQQVRLNGQWPIAFHIDAGSIHAEQIDTVFGSGWRWQWAALEASGQLRQITTVERYDDYPQALLLRTDYENVGSASLQLDEIVQNELVLDALLLNPLDSPYDFWAFGGASYRWGQKVVFPVQADTDQPNYLGQVASGEGGGIPLVYVWNERVGVALAHLEMTPQLWYMPMQVDERGRVHLALAYREPVALSPGERWSGLTSMLSVHQGDFYEPLQEYAAMMRAQGWSPAPPVPEAYEPVWCGWGYEFDFTMDEMLGVIPMLQRLGIRWASIDDRWFDAYGDWQPRTDTFPNGVEDLKRLIAAYHEAGIKVQLWWYPLAVEDGRGVWASHAYQVAEVAQAHPDWLILDENGEPARNNRGLAILCPALPEVQQYVVQLTERFVGEWGVDGHKLDNVYTVPPCYNPAHGHDDPNASVQAMTEVYRLIHETTQRLQPDSVTMLSPCGSTPNVYLLPYVDQPMMSDPFGSWQVRMRVKILKALLGPTAPVFADHVELTDDGQDFASMIGTGGVPGTKFVWPDDPLLEARLRETYYFLDDTKQPQWAAWLAMYRELMLSQGEYRNVYDFIYDAPEGHLIAQGERLYYAFYADYVGDTFEGAIILRGLEPRRYRLWNYETGQEIGIVNGPEARLRATFQSHLLLVAIPD